MSPRQRRGLLLLGLAVLGAVAAFVTVLGYTQSVAAQLGPRRAVVVLVRDVGPFERIDASSLATREVPVVFAPPGALASTDAVGRRVSPLPLPAGTFLQDSSLTDPPTLAPGQRAVTMAMDGVTSIGGTIAVGDVVDVVAGYRDGRTATSKVEIAGVGVLAVTRAADRPDVRLVTLALSQEQTLALARVRASSGTVLVGRFPPTEGAL